jgi:integrase
MATFQAVILSGDIHVRQDKTSNIKIRITHKGKPEYISTDLYVHHKKFKKGYASGPNAEFLNGRIRDELNKYTNRYLRLGSLPEKLNSKELKEELLKDKDTSDIDFIGFADNYIQTLKDQGKDGTVRGFEGLMSNLKSFRNSVTFQEIDVHFLNDFLAYLKKQGVKAAVNNYMRYFRLIFNRGRDTFNDEDRGRIRIPNYPFRRFKIEIPETKTQHNSLTVDQLKIFINYKPVRERQQMAKDMFMLMLFLIGINSKDLYFLGNPDKDGRVNYKRSKTGRQYSIKLEPEAIEIINRYSGEERLLNLSQRYGSNIDFRKYVNLELGKIAESIQLKLQEEDKKATYPQDITTNWARHTWATIARNDCSINKDDIALCLGHEDADNKVTDIYIRYDYSIIDTANKMVISMIKKETP